MVEGQGQDIQTEGIGTGSETLRRAFTITGI